MKWWLVALLVLLAVIVLVSPGIIGRLAEQNLEDSISRADDESGDYVVTQETFERGWFTAAGRHRIEFRHGDVHDAILALMDHQPHDPAPALIVDTRLDHGLLPVTSMSRKSGTLKPSLASTVSTMQLDLGQGELIQVPGTLYSEIGLTGATTSRYRLEAGSFEDAETTAEWQGADVSFTTDAYSRALEYQGSIEPLAVHGGGESAQVERVRFNGRLEKSEFGFSIGSVGLEIGSAALDTRAFGAAAFDAASVRLHSALEDSRLNGSSKIGLRRLVLPELEDGVDLHLDLALNRLDARALAAIIATLRETPAWDDPGRTYGTGHAAIESDLQSLLSAGGELRVDRLDVGLPHGEVTAQLRFDLPVREMGKTFSWAALLLALSASAEVEVPAVLVEMATAANPEAGALIAMGILKRKGDVYGMDAKYAQGLLTVNGAPMPIPLPGR